MNSGPSSARREWRRRSVSAEVKSVPGGWGALKISGGGGGDKR